MDDETLNVSPQDLQRLSPADQRDLQNFVKNEEQKTQVQRAAHEKRAQLGTCGHAYYRTAIHDLTETCFKKCITGSISSGKLASKEESCMTNCVERFMDSNLAVLRHLEMMRAHQ